MTDVACPRTPVQYASRAVLLNDTTGDWMKLDPELAEKPYYSTRTAAKLLNVSLGTVQKMVERGELGRVEDQWRPPSHPQGDRAPAAG